MTITETTTFQFQYKSNQNQIFHYTRCITAEACNKFAGPISASLHPGNIASIEEILQQWQAVDNAASDLNGPQFEPQIFRSRVERVPARPTGRSISIQWC